MLFGAILGKKKSATLGNLQATDADGLLVDVDVQLAVMTVYLHMKISNKMWTITFMLLSSKM